MIAHLRAGRAGRPRRLVRRPPAKAEVPVPSAGRIQRLPRFSDGDPVAIAIAMVGSIIGIAAVALLLIKLFE